MTEFSFRNISEYWIQLYEKLKYFAGIFQLFLVQMYNRRFVERPPAATSENFASFVY